MSNMVEGNMQAVMLNQFSICNSFQTDVEDKGKFAENDFINLFHKKINKKNDKTLFDVSGVGEYRERDIDFVIDCEGGQQLPDIYTVFANPMRYKKVEVKYFGPAYKTGKIAYEMISHSGFGWGFITECDYIYAVLAKDHKQNPYDIAKRGWIKLKDWQNYIKSLKRWEREKCYFNSGENGIANIMTRLDDMEKKGVIKYFD